MSQIDDAIDDHAIDLDGKLLVELEAINLWAA